MSSVAERLAPIVANFSLGAIGDRTDIRRSAAAEAVELTKDLPDDSPEKMCAHALRYGAEAAASRQELQDTLSEARDSALRLRVRELTEAVANGRKRLLPLLEEHDVGSEELDGLLTTLVNELGVLADVLVEDFHVAREGGAS